MNASVNTQINRRTMKELPRMLPRLAQAGARSWQLQLTTAMGRAAAEPDLLRQPFDLLTLQPMLADLAEAARDRGVQFVPGNNIGSSARTSASSAAGRCSSTPAAAGPVGC